MPSDSLLKDSLSEIDEFLANSSLGIFLSNETGRLLDVNEKLVELLRGRSKHEILQHYDSIFSLFKDVEFVSILIGKDKPKKNNISGSNALVTIDHQKVMVTLTAELVKKEGQVRVLGIVCELDPHLISREIIEGLGTHLKELFSNVKDFFYLKDVNGNILAANQVFHELVNQSKKAENDKDDIVHLLEQKDKDFLAENALKDFSGKDFLNEKEIYSHFAVRRLGIPTSEGRLGSVLVYGHDFRQLRESQSAIIDSQTNLRSIIESAHECIWLVDPALKFVKLNSNFKNFVKDFFQTEVNEGY